MQHLNQFSDGMSHWVVAASGDTPRPLPARGTHWERPGGPPWKSVVDMETNLPGAVRPGICTVAELTPAC